MRIGDRTIGADQPPLVIAEIGINHGGDLDVAKAMVRAARAAGGEIVKHQTHFVWDEMTDEAKNVFPPNDPRSIWDVIADASLTPDQEIELKDYAESIGLLYISTPFSRAAADFLDGIDVPAFKIGSGEANNVPLIKHICSFGRPVIMSTGMQSLDTVAASVQVIEAAGVDYALLECTNLYPSPPENVSLRGVRDLAERFPNAVVGFSDHSIGPDMALASVAVGASIIERHFTDSRYRVGPDISASMDPAELRHIVDRSREIWTALHNEKQRTEDEEAVYRFARSSVVADEDLPAGTKLTEDNIWARRPGTGEISGERFYDVVGKTLNVPKRKNETIGWADIGS